MADSEPTHDNPRNTRNLPALVPKGDGARAPADNWLVRAIRTLFGWKAGSVRDDLQVVLDASRPDEVGFSAIERTMLRNILGLHERRIADVMVHRADIIAVKREIPLGELMDLFERAAHSRLVVYNETLDDPEGMVHIRDLLAFMTAKARAPSPTKTRRKKPPPAGLDLRAVDLTLPLSEAHIIRTLNSNWRGIDKPTNVLSFPALQPERAPKPGDAPRMLGDIAIAYETMRREADDEGKPFDHHLSHLAVHGFLHLIGYDHENDADAEAMESLETEILAQLGIPDPYAGRDRMD